MSRIACFLGERPSLAPVHGSVLTSRAALHNRLTGAIEGLVGCFPLNEARGVAVTNRASAEPKGVPGGSIGQHKEDLPLSDDKVVDLWRSGSAGVCGHARKVRFPSIAAAEESVVSAAFGARHTCVLGSQGTVWTMGSSSEGQCGHGVTNDCMAAVPVRSLKGKTITAVAAGQAHTIALGVDGTVYGFGKGSEGALGRHEPAADPGRPTSGPEGDQTEKEAAEPLRRHLTPIEISRGDWSAVPVVEVTAGDCFTAMRTADGEVLVLGWEATWGDKPGKEAGQGEEGEVGEVVSLGGCLRDGNDTVVPARGIAAEGTCLHIRLEDETPPLDAEGWWDQAS